MWSKIAIDKLESCHNNNEDCELLKNLRAVSEYFNERRPMAIGNRSEKSLDELAEVTTLMSNILENMQF